MLPDEAGTGRTGLAGHGGATSVQFPVAARQISQGFCRRRWKKDKLAVGGLALPFF
jgi:hypothetical protein